MNFLNYTSIQKKEILGTDIKAFLNQDDFKINKQNKPESLVIH